MSYDFTIVYGSGWVNDTTPDMELITINDKVSALELCDYLDNYDNVKHYSVMLWNKKLGKYFDVDNKLNRIRNVA